ncbi:zinc finger MYM-type protein 1-like [Sitodiplosis mosellana]|uniref:zinc finger MYM-type protein 1-like n=1 Tax=Sitodiplosis mosellana TaxID=263140 RepID=UPI00244406B2|nr:zinc finger MYM-type protein 1-like [Sitodiplosis mosellana]
MSRYVNVTPRPRSSTNENETESMETESAGTVPIEGIERESSVDKSESSDAESANENDEKSEDERETESGKSVDFNAYDPHTWPDVLPNYFIDQEWLIYSESSDLVYCLYCALFNRKANSFSALGRCYSTWMNINRDVLIHESTLKHHESFKTWIELRKRLQTNQTIDSHQQKLLIKEIDRWKELMKRLVASIQFLAQQSLAFRGHSSTLYDKNNGNFLKLMEMLAKFDPVMADHLNRATTTNKRNYLSNRIQNELIECLATSVTEIIIKAVTESKYYSIMVDYSTGKGVTNSIIAELNKVNLKLQDMRGQGHDNGPNMAGSIKGVQNRILEMNSRALFVPCACHKLNLMVNDTAKVVDSTRHKFFNTVQKCFVFFSESPKCWAILQEMADNGKITLKNVSTTRWASRENATKCRLMNLPKIHAAFCKIANAPNPDDNSYDANNMARKISKFSFICSVVVWHNVLTKINIVSKSLQSQSIDITQCLKLIGNLTSYLKKVREGEGEGDGHNTIDKWFDSAKQIQSQFHLEPNALDNMALQERLDRRERDDSDGDDIRKFRISFVYPILDAALSKLQERFDHLTELEHLFGFLFDLHSYSISLDQCHRLETALTSKTGGSKDVNATELFDEIKSFQALIDNAGEKSPLEFLYKIYEFGLVPIYPNLTTALRVFLTLPVTIASAESSFSKLKLTKNYLRTTMGQDRLSQLATISIESELLGDISHETVINKFATAKARQVFFQ